MFDAGAHVVLRLRWAHSAMVDERGRAFHSLSGAKKLKVGEVGAWRVRLRLAEGRLVPAPVIAPKLPAPLAAKAERKVARRSLKKGAHPDPSSLQAAHFVMVFTTLPEALIASADVLELYRFRWQIELAFKRLKQLLKLGRLPHKDPVAAKSWILAKLVIALLLETLYRNARAFFPWGYSFAVLLS